MYTPNPEIACPVQGKGYNPADYGDQYKAVYKFDYPRLFADMDSGVLPGWATMRKLIVSDIFFIVRFVMGVRKADHPFVVNRCRDIDEGETTGTMDVWAREHFKSLVITQAETIRDICRDPEETHVIFSYKKPKAEDFLFAIRSTIEKPIFYKCFPEIFYENPRTEALSWSLQNGILVKRKNDKKEKTVEAYGLMEGMPTGGHWDRMVYDDVETADLAKNPEQLGILIEMFEMSKNLGTDGGRKRIIGTYYSHCGLLTHLRDKKTIHGTPAYITRIIPATDDGTINGKPVLLSQERLDELKMDKTFNSQQLCDPTPSHELKLNSALWKPIERKFIPKDTIKFMCVDPAGEGTGADKWAFGVFAVQPEIDELGASNVYMIDVAGGKMTSAEAVNSVVQMYLRNGMIMQLGVEKVAGFTTDRHITEALRAFGRRVSEEDRNLKLLKPRNRAKLQRVEDALQWPLVNGKLFYSTDINPLYVNQVKEEMNTFPFFHVDYLDMWAYLYDMLAEYEFNLADEDDYEEELPRIRLAGNSLGGYG